MSEPAGLSPAPQSPCLRFGRGREGRGGKRSTKVKAGLETRAVSLSQVLLLRIAGL